MDRRHRLMGVLNPGVFLREVEPDIYSVCAPDALTNTYDEPGALAFYDRVACNALYNRILWGYATSEFDRLSRGILAAHSDGWVLDAGCGSLAFTADVYRDFTDRPVIFLDQSLRLLKKAKSRMSRKNGLSETLLFLHGDVLSTPFQPNVFKTVIAMNLLHVIKDLESLLREWGRIAVPGCKMLLTTLVESGRWSDCYLRMWGRAGELVPRTAEQILKQLTPFFGPVACRVSGNMAFMSAALTHRHPAIPS